MFHKPNRIILFIAFYMTAIFIAIPLRGDGEDENKIEKLIDLYFASWSSKNISAYKDCFHPDAVIQYMRRDSNIMTYNLSSFMREQAEILILSKNPLREIPLSKKILLEHKIAHVIVKWKLFHNKYEETGYDHFMLALNNNEWKIIYLIFRKE